MRVTQNVFNWWFGISIILIVPIGILFMIAPLDAKASTITGATWFDIGIIVWMINMVICLYVGNQPAKDQ